MDVEVADGHADRYLFAVAYRDENDALRARLEATEARLREAEQAVVEANLRADVAERQARAPEVREPEVRARPAGSVDEHVWTRSVAVFWAWMGIAFVVWQLFEDTTRGPAAS